MKYSPVDTTGNNGLIRKPMAWAGILTGLAMVAILLTAGNGLGQNSFPRVPPAISRIPNQNQADDINGDQAKRQSFEAANAERKRQIDDETDRLLKLATDLKTEVDKTNKDTLSVGVIRKADAIEKLAHDVKEKMKVTVGAG